MLRHTTSSNYRRLPLSSSIHFSVNSSKVNSGFKSKKIILTINDTNRGIDELKAVYNRMFT
jgi:hypothetical protein